MRKQILGSKYVWLVAVCSALALGLSACSTGTDEHPSHKTEHPTSALPTSEHPTNNMAPMNP
jgi:hypothetical protein